MKNSFLLLMIFLFCGLLACAPTDEIPQLTDETTLDQAQIILSDIQSEIEMIAQNKSCDDSSVCKVTAYGTKACGGPSRYIIHGSKIDVNALSIMTDRYTRIEHEMNEKFGIVSTCEVMPIPDVTCLDGECVEVEIQTQ